MKNLKRLFNLSFFFVWLSIMFVSCVKKDDYYKKDTTTETNRKEIVQFAKATGLISIARTANGGMDTFALIDVRRYPNNETGLNEPLTIKLQADSTLIDAYDTANGKAYVQLPSSAYTLSSDFTTITFGPGEGDKIIKIFLNQALLDFSLQYALAFTITDGGGATINPGQQNAIYAIGVKNAYDGSYELWIETDGWGGYGIADGPPINDWSAAAGGNLGLITSGANSVVFDFGAQPALTTAGGATGFGATNPQLTFDPVTNKLLSVVNLTPDDGRGRAFAIDPAFDSYFDPVTKLIIAHYKMFQLTRPTQYIYDSLIYKGPR